MKISNRVGQKVAIIGGNGFIGKNFTNFFVECNFEVKVIDRHIDTTIGLPNISSFSVDIHHTQELINILEDVEFIIWLVHASVPSTQDDSLVDDFSLNVSPIIKFLEKASKLRNLKKFIYLSSGGTVYGEAEGHFPIKEYHTQKPISNYGLSKSIAENYIEYLTTGSNFESVIFRPSNVFGRHQNLVKPQGIIGFAFKAIHDDKFLDLFDEGKVIRDFIYVLDVADAINKSLYLPLEIGLTRYYNIGSEEGLSIQEVLTKIENITGKKLNLNHKVSRKFDCSYNVLDISKAKKELGWDIKTKIDDGLLNVWDWINGENAK